MIVKRIRQTAKRQQRPLRDISTVINVLSTYVLNASSNRLNAADGENALARYILDTQILGEVTEPGEKVDFHGSRCLVGEKLFHHQRQMVAANLLAPGAKDPVEHYMLSWQMGEMPERAQVHEAVDIFAQEMGYQNCQIIWATHSNTANYHLHLVVNRIDLALRKVVSPGDGWEIDRLHQVTALIEDRQGWASETNAIYAARGGEVRERATGNIVRKANGSRENCATRKRAAPEICQTPEYASIVAALQAAQTWQDLHNRLIKLDASYRTKGSGAEITIGQARMKAAAFGREFSYKRMTERLGDYAPDIMIERDPYEIYKEALRAQRKHIREALNEALAILKDRRKRALKKALAAKKAYEAMIVEARIDLCFDLAEVEVKRAFDRARLTIAETALRRDAWHKAGCPPAIPVKLPQLVMVPDVPRDEWIADAHGLKGRAGECEVEYFRGDGILALTDVGVALIVHQIERETIAASLAMANIRGDGISVAGSQEFLDICRELAEEHDYIVTTQDGAVLHNSATKQQPLPAAQELSPTSEQLANQDRRASSGDTASKVRQRTTTDLPTLSPAPVVATLSPAFEENELSEDVLWAAMQGQRKNLGR